MYRIYFFEGAMTNGTNSFKIYFLSFNDIFFFIRGPLASIDATDTTIKHDYIAGVGMPKFIIGIVLELPTLM